MLRALTLVVESDSGEPVYGQIAHQVREAIASGALPCGFRLPSVRRLASDLGLNLNTVARAYRQLEEEGFVRILPRSGARVEAPVRVAGPGARNRFKGNLRELLARMRQAGIRPAEVRRLVDREIDSLPGPSGSSR